MKTIGWKNDTIRKRNFTVKISRQEELLLTFESKRTGKTATELSREGFLTQIKEKDEADWLH